MPKALSLLAVLLFAALAVGASADTAAAHGKHAHQASAGHAAPAARAADVHRSAPGQAAMALDEQPQNAPVHHGTVECCCGSMMCHAGATLAADAFSFLPPAGAPLLFEPSSGRPQRASSGLERPPRTLDIA